MAEEKKADHRKKQLEYYYRKKEEYQEFIDTKRIAGLECYCCLSIFTTAIQLRWLLGC